MLCMQGLQQPLSANDLQILEVAGIMECNQVPVTGQGDHPAEMVDREALGYLAG